MSRSDDPHLSDAMQDWFLGTGRYALGAAASSRYRPPRCEKPACGAFDNEGRLWWCRGHAPAWMVAPAEPEPAAAVREFARSLGVALLDWQVDFVVAASEGVWPGYRCEGMGT